MLRATGEDDGERTDDSEKKKLNTRTCYQFRTMMTKSDDHVLSVPQIPASRSERGHLPPFVRPGAYRVPADERASRMASRLRQKSICSFNPRLLVTSVLEHTGHSCSVSSSFIVEVGWGEIVPPDLNRSDVTSGPSPKQNSSFSSSTSPLVLRRLFDLVGLAPAGSKNYPQVGSELTISRSTKRTRLIPFLSSSLRSFSLVTLNPMSLKLRGNSGINSSFPI